jgi:predicted ABC-type transport system involved in lysophospholipase L1 biosynthesis ATPase subunit
MRGAARLVGALGLAAGLSGCTAAPQSIAQSDVSPISYDSLNCFDLLDELEQVDPALIHTSQQQEQAQGSDAARGVSVIGVPASTLSGTDVAPQLGGREEQRQAIQRAIAQKQCRVTLDAERVTSWRSKD